MKRAFNPEFLNRLDEVILFTSFNDDDLLKIIDLRTTLITILWMGTLGGRTPVRIARKRR